MKRNCLTRMIAGSIVAALLVGIIPVSAAETGGSDVPSTPVQMGSLSGQQQVVQDGVAVQAVVEPRTREELLALDGVKLSEDGEVISVNTSKTGELSYAELQLLFFGDQPMAYSNADQDQRLREHFGLTQTQIEQGVSLHGSRLAFTSQLADLTRSGEDMELAPEQVRVLAELIASGYTNTQAQLAVVSKDILGFTLEQLEEAQKAELEAAYQDDNATEEWEGDEATYLAGKLGLPNALVAEALEARDGYEIEQAMEQAMDRVWDSAYPDSENIAVTFAAPSEKTAYAPEKILGQPYSYDQQGNFDININTGAYSYTETDLNIPGKNGLDLVLTRQYHSDRANTMQTLGYYDNRGKASDISEAETYSSDPNATFKVFYRWFVIGGSDENGRYTFERELIEHSWYEIPNAGNKQVADTEAYFTLANYEYAVDTMNAMNEAVAGELFTVMDGSYARTMTLVADIKEFGRYFVRDAVNESIEDNYYVDEFGLGHGWMLGLSHLKWVFEGYGDYDALDTRLKLTLSDGTQYNIEKRIGTSGNYITGYEADDIEFHACKDGEYPNARYGLYHKDGKVEYFDYNGRNIAIRDRLGNTITIDYTLEGKRVKKIEITDTLGNIVVYEEVALEGNVPNGVRPFDYNKRWRLSLNGATIREYFSKREEKSLYIDSKTGQSKYTYPTRLVAVANEAGELTRYASGAVSVRYNSFLQPATHTLLTDSKALCTNDGYNALVQMNSVTYPNGGVSEVRLNSVRKPVETLGNNGYQHYLCCDVVIPMNSGADNGNQPTITYTHGDFDNLEGLRKAASNRYYTVVKNEQTYPYYDESGELTSGSRRWANHQIEYRFDTNSRIKAEYKNSYEAMPLRQDGIPSEDPSLPEVPSSWTSQTTYYTYDSSEDRHPSEITTTYKDATGATMTATEKYTYDSKCNVLRHTRPDGQEVRYSYNSYSQPKTVTLTQDATTTVVTTNYFSQGDKVLERTEVTSNDSLVGKTVYHYDEFGQLVSQDAYKDASNYVTTNYAYNYAASALPAQISVSGIKTASGTLAASSPDYTTGTVVRKQAYNARGWITSETDGNGNTTNYSYDAVGRLTSATLPDGNSVSYSYDVAHNKVTYTDAAGNQWLYSYGKSGKLGEVKDLTSNTILQTNTYDRCDHLVKVEIGDTPKQTVYYRYDTDGRLIEQENVDESGNVMYQELYKYEDGTGKVTRTITSDSVAPSIVTTTYQDNMGNIVATGIFRNGVEEKDTYTYDYLGNQTQVMTAYTASQKGSHGPTVTNTHDYAGRLLTSADAAGNTAVKTYDWLGNQLTEKDPAGNEITYTYDALGRAIQVDGLIAAGHISRTTYTYDANGNVIQERTLTGAKGDTSSARVTEYEYDNMNRLTEVKGNARLDGQSGANQYQHTTYTYDDLGNILTMAVGDGSNTETTNYTYDRYSRLLTETNALGYTQSYTYDQLGNLLSKTDRRGVTTNNTYDAMGRLVDSTAGSDSLSFAYTMTGQRRSATSNGQTTTYTYNDAGDLIQEVGPYATKAMTYGTGGLRNRLTVTANGTTYLDNQYTYDNLGQLTKVNAGEVSAHYSYKSNGNLANVTNGNGTTTAYNYNKSNLPTEVKNKAGGTVRSTFSYTYGADGNQLTKKDNLNRQTSYTYDGLNRLTQETLTGSGAYANTYTYDAFSNRQTATLDGVTTNYTYDAANRLLSTTGGAAAAYTYDAQGNQTQSTVTLGNETVTFDFTYDGFNRLKKVSDNTNETVYTYDADGLRSSKTSSAGEIERYVYDNGQLVVTLHGGRQIAQFELSTNAGEYVRSGELISGKKYWVVVNGTEYAATAEFIRGEDDQQATFSTRVGMIGGEGRPELPPVVQWDRIVLQAGPVTIEMRPEIPAFEDGTFSAYVLGPTNVDIAVYNGKPDSLNDTYIRGLSLIASVKDGAPTYYHYDAHGNVVQLTDATGAVVKDYTYDAFGVEKNATANDTNPFRYCGEQYDAETGNYYLRARYYTPTTGRFTQVDPAQDGINWYAYGYGNPVSFIDSSGLDAVLITASDAAAHQGHTSVLIQDTRDGNWYYFYWGNKSAYFVEVPWKNGAMSSLGAFNNWLNEQDLPYNTTNYTSATYIEGDFNASADYFRDLVNNTKIESGYRLEATRYDKPTREYYQTNTEYRLLSANCLQMTMKGFCKGKFIDGTSVDSFMSGQLNLILGIRPNSAKKVFDQLFFNTSFTRSDAKQEVLQKTLHSHGSGKYAGKGLYYAATMGVI